MTATFPTIIAAIPGFTALTDQGPFPVIAWYLSEDEEFGVDVLPITPYGILTDGKYSLQFEGAQV